MRRGRVLPGGDCSGAAGEPAGELADVALDEALALGELLVADGHGLGGDVPESVDVVEVNAVELVDGGIDIARDGKIDDEDGAIAAASHGLAELLRGDDEVRSGG